MGKARPVSESLSSADVVSDDTTRFESEEQKSVRGPEERGGDK